MADLPLNPNEESAQAVVAAIERDLVYRKSIAVHNA
jgi:hypothetical protein